MVEQQLKNVTIDILGMMMQPIITSNVSTTRGTVIEAEIVE